MDQVVIRGLRQLDYLELQKSVETSELRRLGQDSPGQQFGELGTIAVLLVLSSGAVFGLAAWLLKKREGNKVVLNIEKRGSDGTSEILHFEQILTTSEAPKAAAIAAIAQGLAKVLGVTLPKGDESA